MAPSGSTGRRTAASRGASQRTQPDTPSSDPARPPRRTAVANSPYASKEAPGKGKDKAQSPSKGKDKRTNKPAPPVKRAKKDRGAGKKQATSDDEGEAEDGEGQGMCLACQKSDKDATSVECDRYRTGRKDPSCRRLTPLYPSSALLADFLAFAFLQMREAVSLVLRLVGSRRRRPQSRQVALLGLLRSVAYLANFPALRSSSHYEGLSEERLDRHARLVAPVFRQFFTRTRTETTA
ncbi:hypothetical protein AAT19DRAFT_11918 [Rhodotorula toruloides]|uniref:Uncharacterized protein n=1 Tax=Rhodotorula toruloides TaxID=5286 RepID=A0A2T0AER8_RHOTO|nr:hypothetical protein AAT19DRAFT_11918 [Rhodotorula toruloides]